MGDFSTDDFVPDTAPVNQNEAQDAFSPHDFVPDTAPVNQSMADQTGRAMGVAGRDITEAIAAPFTGGSDLAAKYGNFVTSDFNNRFGTNIPKIPDDTTGALDQVLTKAGMPQSQGNVEKFTQAAAPYIMNSMQAIPAIKEAAANVGDMIANTSVGKKVADYLGSKFGPEQTKGQNIVAQALKAENLTPEQVGDRLTEAQKTNPDATALDVLVQDKNGVLTGGRNFIGLTKAAATFPGDAPAMSADVVSRASGMRDRVNGAVDNYLSSTPYYTADKDFAEQMKGAAPAYQKVFAGGSTAPLEEQFGTQFDALSKQDKAADQMLNGANNRMTQAQAQLSRAGDDTYGVGSGNAAVKDAQSDIEEAQQLKQQTAQQKQDALTRLQGAQQDRTNGVRGGIWNPTVERALQQPEIQAGIRKGMQLERLDAFSEGRPFNPTEYAIKGFDTDGNPIAGSVPNMRLLDAGKRGLDSLIQAEEKPTGGYTQLGRSLIKAKNTYVNSLDEANPDYAIARQTYGDAASQRQALQQGRDFTSMDPEKISDFMSNPKTPLADKRAFAIGARRNVADTMDSNSSDARALSNLWKNSYQKRFAAMSNDKDAFNDFAQAMNDEKKEAMINQIHTSGSDTMLKNNFGQQIEGSSAPGLLGRVAHAFTSPGTSAMTEAARFLEGGLQKRAAGMSHQTAAEVMRHMTTQDPNVWYNFGKNTMPNTPINTSSGAIFQVPGVYGPQGSDQKHARGGRIRTHTGKVVKKPVSYPALEAMRKRP